MDLRLKLDDFSFTINESLHRKNISGIHDYNLRILRDPQRLGIAIVATILLIATIITNVSSVVANFKRTMRPIFRACLISLGCSDLVTASFIYTTYISQMTNEFPATWTLGDIMCSFTPFATTAAILANSMTLVGIALDRYLAIVKYINGSWNPNTLLCVSWAIFVWGLASGIASPMLSSFYLIEFYVILTDPTNSTNEIGYQSSCSCMGDKESNKYYYTVVFVLIFLPQLIAFNWLYTIIAKEIWNRRRPFKTKSCVPNEVDENNFAGDKQTCETIFTDQPNSAFSGKTKETTASSDLRLPSPTVGTNSADVAARSIKNKNKSSPKTRRQIRQLRMFAAILILMLTFLICRLPTWVFLLYKLYNPAKTNSLWMLQYCLGLLSITNCVLNPLLYTFLTETIQCSFQFYDRLRNFPRLCRTLTLSHSNINNNNGHNENIRTN